MIYTQFLEKILLPIGSIISKNNFSSYLRFLRLCDTKNENELLELQARKLLLVLQNAKDKSQFYKSIDFNSTEVNTLSILKKFPILTKEILKNEAEKLLTKPKDTLIKCCSSGSSGVMSAVYLTPQELGVAQATQLHWWNWAGYKSGEKLLQTGMTPKRGVVKSIKDCLFNTIYIPAFSLSEKEILSILNSIKNDKYTLAGYASSMYVFAKIALKYNLNITFKRALSWGDKLFDHYRENITRAFKCKTFDTYGCSEGMLISAQKDLDFQYIMTQNVYIEIVDDNGNEVPDGQIGHVLVTNLNAFAMPIIRYKLGDLAVKLPKEKYPTKRDFAYPLLKMIVGRDTDLVKTPSGKVLIVHTFTGILEFYPEIKQFRIIQKNINGIDVEYIPCVGFTNKVIETLKKELYEKISEKEETFVINFIEVTTIAPTKSGKPQIIESFLHKSKS